MVSTSDKSRHTSTVILSEVDGRLQEVAKASSPFFKNHNLLILYPSGLLPSTTLGFDSAMMNGLQAVAAWDTCKSSGPLETSLGRVHLSIFLP
jgi:hypothetical protein